MIERFKQGELTWINIISPTSEDVRIILDELDIKPHLVNDLTTPVPRSNAESTDKTLKITFDYPIVKRTDIRHPLEIKFLVTRTHLVTIHFEEIDAIHQFKKEFETLSILKKPSKDATAVHILFSLLHHLYDGLHKKLDYLDGKIASVDEAIHEEKEREMVYEISRINRRIIAFRHVLQTYEPVLSDIHATIAKPFGTEYIIYVKDLSRSYHQIVRRLRSMSDTIDELRDTNVGILTTKQNEIMKVLTILAFITFPLTLFTSMFGMNTKATPIVGKDGDFWIILGIMVVVSVVFFGYFKYKKWM